MTEQEAARAVVGLLKDERPGRSDSIEERGRAVQAGCIVRAMGCAHGACWPEVLTERVWLMEVGGNCKRKGLVEFVELVGLIGFVELVGLIGFVELVGLIGFVGLGAGGLLGWVVCFGGVIEVVVAVGQQDKAYTVGAAFSRDREGKVFVAGGVLGGCAVLGVDNSVLAGSCRSFYPISLPYIACEYENGVVA